MSEGLSKAYMHMCHHISCAAHEKKARDKKKTILGSERW
jgi:hypothetical protein